MNTDPYSYSVFVHLPSSQIVQNEMLYDTLIYRTTDLSTLAIILSRSSVFGREAEVENLTCEVEPLFTRYIPITIILFSYNFTHGKILEYFITAVNRPIIYKEDMHILHNYEKYLKIIRGKVQRLPKVSPKFRNTTREFYLSIQVVPVCYGLINES